MDGVANLFFRTGNAFALQPTEFPEVTWLLSDVICYPSKLWDWLQPWLTQSKVKNFVVTVKMQGKDCDWPTLAKFAGVEGSRLLHLPHNKHELTWLLVRG
jgi:23S rRNA (cytidine2498-2'-O)-methyltransferase